MELVSEDSEGRSRAVGEEATYEVNEGVLRLRGEALVTSPRGELRAEAVEVDRSNRVVKATGMWKVRIPVSKELQTEALRLR